MSIEDDKRLEAAEQFLNLFPGEGRHQKLKGALQTLLQVTGPPIDPACAHFAPLATAGAGDNRRVDVHMLAEGRTEIHGGDGSLETFVEKPDDEPEPEPEPTLQ